MPRDHHVQFVPELDGEPLLAVDGATVEYPGARMRRGGAVRAVDQVSLTVRAGSSVGLVGESGCGKTSLGRSIVGLAPLSEGTITVAERDHGYSSRYGGRLSRSVQMVFQDPFASLDPRQTIGSAIAEPMVVHRMGTAEERKATVAGLLERVGLSASMASSYPHQLSGGQRQRVCIARALAVRPLLLVCDEPTSALDVSIQAQVVELLQELQRDEGVTYLFITHDLALLPQLVDRVAVMYLGRMVETGPVDDVLGAPHHPYTTALVAAAPVLGERRGDRISTMLTGEALLDDEPDTGCAFRPRCWRYRDLDDTDRAVCRAEVPELVTVPGTDHQAACHHATAVRVEISTPSTPSTPTTSETGGHLHGDPSMRGH
ncbi:MAG: oligopeptide/dipeptide ABC transporter ATP-binding protein [Acidimicrobiales bacterium]